MTRERKAARERRSIHLQLRKGARAPRRAPSPLERLVLFRAVDARDPNAFSLRWLHDLNLDALHRMPPMHPAEICAHRLTVLSYAAWRRRHRIVKALLVAGASASVSARKPLGALHETPEEEDRLTDLLTRRRGGGFDFATAAHVVGCVVRMRTIAARDEGLGLPLGACVRCAATGSSVSFDPCGCVVCEGCVWRRVLSEAQGGGVQGDVRCPQCAAVCPLRGHGGSDGAKGGDGEGHGEGEDVQGAGEGTLAAPAGVDATAEAAPEGAGICKKDDAARGGGGGGGGGGRSWRCECCCYSNYGRRPFCRNCLGARPPPSRALPPSRHPMAEIDAASPEAPAAEEEEEEEEEEEAQGMMALASPAPRVVVEMWLRERRLLGQQLTYLCGHMARVVVGEGESEGEGGGEGGGVGGGVGGCAWEREVDGDWEAVDPTERLARHDKGDGIRAVVGGQDGAAGDDDDTNSADDTSACSSAPSAATGQHASSLAWLAALRSAPVELVIDTYAMRHGGNELEAALLHCGPFPGERVRAVGRPWLRVAPEGSQRVWEVHAEAAVLLRPTWPIQTQSPHGGANVPPSDARSTPRKRFEALPPREAAAARLRALDHTQRCEYAAEAAMCGECTHLEALQAIGFDLSRPLNEYGQTPLVLAAWNGHEAAVTLLLALGADARRAAHGGATAAMAAAGAGHAALAKRLARAAAGDDAALDEDEANFWEERAVPELVASSPEAAATPAPLPSLLPLPPPPPMPPAAARLMRLIASDAMHPGAGACYIDGGVPEATLSALVDLFATLPAASQRDSQGLSTRHYFCDVQGHAVAVLGAAVRAAVDNARASGEDARLPCDGDALPQMRFLCYAEAGGGLAPHTDLSRTRRSDGRTSRCTFLLYLSDCASGGRTVLLEQLQGGSVLAEVVPTRGRLLLFPHACPHRADEVVAEGLPKILLRGEMV